MDHEKRTNCMDAPSAAVRTCDPFIYADAGGRPIGHLVICHEHGRERIARDRAAGLRVYDGKRDRADGTVLNED